MPLTIKASSLLSALASLILAWPAVGSAADEAKVTNIAPNPGAEKGQAGKLPEGWSHYRNTPAKAGITEKVRHGGKRSAYLKVTGFGKDGCAYTGITVGRTDCIKGPKAISVKPNTKYYFSFFIKGEGFAGKIIVKPCGFKSNGGSVDQDIPGIEVIPKTGWLRHMGSFITGAETEQVVLMFHVSGLKNRDVKLGAVFYIDDVCFGINESDAKMELLGWRGEAMAKDLWMIPDNFARKIRHISDEELFEAMDLTRPGMEDISKAVKSRDYTAAYRAWAAYWERMHQEKPTPPATQESPGESRFDLAAA
ncbi:MAG: hypothetical protein SVV80_09260, partial [Planctomycetota bacterium]|nr:hypothetical protein [Planctomycetota bacterium]